MAHISLLEHIYKYKTIIIFFFLLICLKKYGHKVAYQFQTKLYSLVISLHNYVSMLHNFYNFSTEYTLVFINNHTNF